MIVETGLIFFAAQGTFTPFAPPLTGKWLEVMGASGPLRFTFDDGTTVTLFSGDFIEKDFTALTCNNRNNLPGYVYLRKGDANSKPIKTNAERRAMYLGDPTPINVGIGAATQIWWGGSTAQLQQNNNSAIEIVAVWVAMPSGNGAVNVSQTASGAAAGGVFIEPSSPMRLPPGGTLFAYSATETSIVSATAEIR